MWQSLIHSLGTWQGDIIRSLSATMRGGGGGILALAFALGALHALTPGHGKAALAAYFLGNDASPGRGVRIALSAALLHVLSGLVAFLVLRFVLQQMPSITGRGSPVFAAVGYGLLVVAGLIVLLQSLRSAHVHGDGAYALAAGIGLLPCPLTISVLGFAWAQGDAATIGVALVSLALGISLTIAIVAVLAIASRRLLGQALAAWLPKLDSGARFVQAAAGLAVMALGTVMLWSLRG